MRVVAGSIGPTIEASGYRLRVDSRTAVARYEDARDATWAELRLLASIDTIGGRDETLSIDEPTLETLGGSEESPQAARIAWAHHSSLWRAKRIVLVCTDRHVAVHTEVEGDGRLTDVALLGGRAEHASGASGQFSSGRWFETLFSAAPADPRRIVVPAGESAINSAAGGSEPGRGHWFFTPGPLVYAVSRSPTDDPAKPPGGPWLWFGLATPPGEAGFVGFAYKAHDRGFHFALDYDGQTDVHGSWRSPGVVIGAAADPYASIRDHRRYLEEHGLAPLALPIPPDEPAWWREPMFCGWGAQCALALRAGLPFSAAPNFSTQEHYDRFLAHLEDRGIVPGTIAIDDKWALAYGTCEPDADKWPDLRGWIARRHEREQRVVLWWKAWDPEGLAPGLCVRTAAGTPVAIDPDHPDGAAAVRDAVDRMLSRRGLDADGLKIDFTARTPTGSSLIHAGVGWGIELLRRLLAIVNDEAKRAKPDCLLVGQVPEATIAPSVDMIRLNDMLRLDDPEPRVPIVPQMQYRAAVARVACPGHLIDTDDWCAPDLASWREYAEVKPELGVPALYYVDGLDLSGERFEDEDYGLVRRTWAAYRARHGLPARATSTQSAVT